MRRADGGTEPSRTKGAQFGKTVLENGVRVVTEALPGVRSISIGVVIDCGSKDESAEEPGLAHLCEHLTFQGTSGRDAIEIARHMDSCGGNIGGFTTRDYTCYFAETLDDYRFHALDLLGDVLLNSTYPEASIEREKQAILNEMARDSDMPEQRVHTLAKKNAWTGHELGRPVAGTSDSIRRFTREDAIYFLHRHYTPDRLIVAAAGSLEHEDFVAQTRDSFWRLIGSRRPVAVRHLRFHPGLTIENTASSQAYFCLVMPAPCYAARDRYAVHVFNRILGGGISSRLFRRLREEMGLVYDVQSEYHAYRDAGMLSIEGSAAGQHLIEVIAEVLDATAALLSWREPVSAEELWRAGIHIRTQHLISSEDVHTRMSRIAVQELYFGAYINPQEVLHHIDQVDLKAIRAIARYSRRQFARAHLVVAGPIGDQPLVRQQLTKLLEQFAWSGKPLK